jgi:tryptophan synthase beta subunit
MNIQNNGQNNTGKQNSTDYYKDLKDILKEIDKIYKKLSKDESLADMIDSIKNDFIGKNIALIEKSLLKPNYKEFNSKIIKIVDIIIKLLIKHNN